MLSDEPIRVFQVTASPTSLPLQRNSARRQFDLSVGIVALTLVLGIAAGVSHIAQHGFSAHPVGGYGVDDIVAKVGPASTTIKG